VCLYVPPLNQLQPIVVTPCHDSRRLSAGLSSRRTHFDPMPSLVGTCREKLAPAQVFLPQIHFSMSFPQFGARTIFFKGAMYDFGSFFVNVFWKNCNIIQSLYVALSVSSIVFQEIPCINNFFTLVSAVRCLYHEFLRNGRKF